MDQATTAKVVEVTLNGEVRTIKFGLRALKMMGINPFNPVEALEYERRLAAFKAGTDAPTPEWLALQVCAGLQHEYFGKNAPRKGQNAPTTQEILDDYFDDDPSVMIEVMTALSAAFEVDGGDSEPPKSNTPPDPPSA